MRALPKGFVGIVPLLLLMAGLVAALGSPVQADADFAGAACVPVSGTIWAQSVPEFDGEVLVGFDVVVTDATGLLGGGEVTASLNVIRFFADGSMEFDGEHRFSGTRAGTFATADHGITTGEGGVADSLTIVEGGTGFLVTMGHIDLATGQLELSYHGVVCPADM